MLKKISIAIVIIAVSVGIIAFAFNNTTIFNNTADAGFTVDVDIDYSTNTMTISGMANGSDRVTLYVESPTRRLEWIGSARVINGSYNVSFGILNPIPDGEYTLTIKASEISEPVVKEVMWDAPSTKIEFETREGEIHNVIVTADNMSNSNREVAVQFNPLYLRVEDSMSRTFERTLNAGVGIRTDVNVIEFNPNAGLIRFRVSYDIENDRTLSGVPILVRFVGLRTGNTTVEVQ